MRSWAQRYEDLTLWRALKGVERGFYIDVGAGHPENINVSKMFYDLGWRGINIEPDVFLYAQLIERRARDINLCIAAGSENGLAKLWCYDGIGLIADKPDVRKVFEDAGHSGHEALLATRTLDNILAEYRPPDDQIHFLKIDVEGCEEEVLRGIDLDKHRPWIIVVEATLPTTEVRSDHLWDHLLFEFGYIYACFDGLNCYYVAKEHGDLIEPLQIKEPTVKIAFVYVTHKPDLHWLSRSLQFLRRNWREPGTEIVVRGEPDCMDIFKTWGVPGVTYHQIGQWADGYAFQMYQKLTADQWTDADLICLIDSDVMLLGPAWLDDLMVNGKILVDYLPWSSSPESERIWRAPSSAALGIDVDNDYMVRMPFCFWRETFAKCRAQIEKTTGKELQDFMFNFSGQHYSPKTFTGHRFPLADYEVLGAYAVKQEPDKYVMRDARDRVGHWPFRVYWSHGDWTAAVEADLDRRLRL